MFISLHSAHVYLSMSCCMHMLLRNYNMNTVLYEYRSTYRLLLYSASVLSCDIVFTGFTWDFPVTCPWQQQSPQTWSQMQWWSGLLLQMLSLYRAGKRERESCTISLAALLPGSLPCTEAGNLVVKGKNNIATYVNICFLVLTCLATGSR